MNRNAEVINLDLKRYKRNRRGLSKSIGKISSEFFKASFVKEGKTDRGFQAWDQRNFEFPGKKRALLKKSGALNRDIRYTTKPNQTRVFTTLPYSGIHNEGGRIRVTAKMRKFFWAMYYKEMAGRKTKDKTAKAEIWKSLALTKNSHFDIKARPFIYHSKELNDKIDRLVDHIIKLSTK